MEIIWSDLALESLSEISSYVQSFFGIQTADTIATQIISFVDKLGRFPQLGKQLQYLPCHGGIRCAFYKQNHIYYQLFEDRIEIILIWDGRQNPHRLRQLLSDFFQK